MPFSEITKFNHGVALKCFFDDDDDNDNYDVI